MDPAYTQQYEQFERFHWWHVARRELIQYFLRRFVLDRRTDPRWLDAGCSTGVLLDSFADIPKDRKVGAELDEGSAAAGRAKGLDVRPIQTTWDFKPFGTFDVVTLCDVIEHVEHEAPSLAAVREVLNDGGIVLVTVPALMSLWSNHDVINHHFRRYTKEELLARFPADQWEVLRASYFCFFLLPFVWGVRKIKNWRYGVGAESAAHAPTDTSLGPPVVRDILLALFRLECRIVRRMGMPLGSSLILVLRKK